MTKTSIVNVDEIVGRGKLTSFHVTAFILGVLMLFIDGIDYASASVGAPALMKAFDVDNSSMGLIFGAGNLGILIGGLAFAAVSDALGRKWTSIIGTIVFSIPALAIAFATSAEQLMLFRFLTGLGVGGVTVTGIAYLTECAPKRLRSAFVMAGMFGYGLGGSVLALFAASFVADWGWRAIFLPPAILGFMLAAVLAWAMPESLLYLAAKSPSSPELRRRIARMAPELKIDEHTRFVTAKRDQAEQLSIKALFAGPLKLATPLLCIGYLFEGLGYITFLSWFFVIMGELGLSPGDATIAYATALGAVKIPLALLLMFIIDRLSLVSGAALAVVTSSAVAVMALSGLPHWGLIAVAAIALATSGAIHQVFQSTVGTFYPTEVRARGIGVTSSCGRIGMIIGPIVLGFALSSVPLRTIIYGMSILYLAVAPICVWLGYLYFRKIRAK
jgi:AAHS family 4-hydroxybenzoate transporter-like MFS transporter